MAKTFDFRALTSAEQLKVADIAQKISALGVEKAKIQTARATAESGWNAETLVIDAEIHKLNDELSYMREAIVTEK